MLHSFAADETCFVPVDRVYECGSDVASERECEDMGCCFNYTASIQCYHPSGTHIVHTYAHVRNIHIHSNIRTLDSVLPCCIAKTTNFCGSIFSACF